MGEHCAWLVHSTDQVLHAWRDTCHLQSWIEDMWHGHLSMDLEPMSSSHRKICCVAAMLVDGEIGILYPMIHAQDEQWVFHPEHLSLVLECVYELTDGVVSEKAVVFEAIAFAKSVRQHRCEYLHQMVLAHVEHFFETVGMPAIWAFSTWVQVMEKKMHLFSALARRTCLRGLRHHFDAHIAQFQAFLPSIVTRFRKLMYRSHVRKKWE